VHRLWLTVILALYLGLAYLIRATERFHVYSVLGPGGGREGGRGGVCLWDCGCVPGRLLRGLGVIWVSKWVTEGKIGRESKFADRAGALREEERNLEISVSEGWEVRFFQ